MDLNIRVRYKADELPELLGLLKAVKNRKLARRVRIMDFAVHDPERLLEVGGK